MRLLDVEHAPGQTVATPLVAQSAIDADPDLARTFTLLNANGSTVQFGPMTPVSPTARWCGCVRSSSPRPSNTTVPRLYGVVAVSDGLVGFGPDAPAALDAAVAQETGA